MTFGKGRRPYNRLLLLGNVFLIPAIMSNRALLHYTHLSEEISDGVVGLLYGLAIGCYIVGIRRMVRGSTHDAGSCA